MPVILMAHFVDNVYLGMTGIDQQSQELLAVLFFIETLLDVGEILSADTVGACAGPSSHSTPVVIMSRYRDNVYFALVGISPLPEAPDLFIIKKLTEVLYRIPLKWEPHGQVTT